MGRVEVLIAGKPCRLITPEVASWLSIIGRDPAEYNRLTWPAGAARWAHAKFLMLKSDLPSTLTGAKQIVFKSPADQVEDVKIGGMYFGHVRPLNQRGPNEQDGLVEVEMFDERYHWQFKDVSEVANLSVQYKREDHFTEGDATSWSDLVTNVLTDLGVNGRTINNTPATATNPDDMQFFREPAGRTVDRIASALGCAFVAEIRDGAPAYEIAPYEQYGDNILALVDTSQTIPEKFLMAGGIIYNPTTPEGKATLNRVMPNQVRVLFPRSKTRIALGLQATTGVEEDQYYEKTSTNGRPDGATGIADTDATIYDTLWARGTIDSEDNTSDLDSRADELAGFYFDRFKQVKAHAILHGFHKALGFPGTVEWLYHPEGPLTIVDAPEEWYAHGMDRDIDGVGFHDMNISGIDGYQVIKDAGGGIRVGFHHPQIFMAKVRKSSGVVGPPSTWKYDMDDLNDNEMQEDVAPERSRMAAVKYDFAADGTWAICWIDPVNDRPGVVLALDEVPQTNECT